jgi:hypothetical protein
VITVAGVLLGIALVRLAGPREPWLRAAMLAQVADLVTFATVWEHSGGELNPLGGLVRDSALLAMGVGHDDLAAALAAIVLAVLKIGLIAFLVRFAADFGRFRSVVMALASVAGTIGATSNVIAYPNAGASLAVVGALAIVEIRWPSRFRAALAVGAWLSAAVLLGIGGLASVSYLQWLAEGYGCEQIACAPPWKPLVEALAIAFFGSAMLMLWMTVRLFRRLLSQGAAGAD